MFGAKEILWPNRSFPFVVPVPYLARRLARRENRSIADIVERALEAYEVREAGREPAANFYRVCQTFGADVDLDELIRESRVTHTGPDL